MKAYAQYAMLFVKSFIFYCISGIRSKEIRPGLLVILFIGGFTKHFLH